MDGGPREGRTAMLFLRLTPPTFDPAILITFRKRALRNFSTKKGFTGSDSSVAAERWAGAPSLPPHPPPGRPNLKLFAAARPRLSGAEGTRGLPAVHYFPLCIGLKIRSGNPNSGSARPGPQPSRAGGFLGARLWRRPRVGLGRRGWGGGAGGAPCCRRGPGLACPGRGPPRERRRRGQQARAARHSGVAPRSVSPATPPPRPAFPARLSEVARSPFPPRSRAQQVTEGGGGVVLGLLERCARGGAGDARGGDARQRLGRRVRLAASAQLLRSLLMLRTVSFPSVLPSYTKMGSLAFQFSLKSPTNATC